MYEYAYTISKAIYEHQMTAKRQYNLCSRRYTCIYRFICNYVYKGIILYFLLLSWSNVCAFIHVCKYVCENRINWKCFCIYVNGFKQIFLLFFFFIFLLLCTYYYYFCISWVVLMTHKKSDAKKWFSNSLSG